MVSINSYLQSLGLDFFFHHPCQSLYRLILIILCHGQYCGSLSHHRFQSFYKLIMIYFLSWIVFQQPQMRLPHMLYFMDNTIEVISTIFIEHIHIYPAPSLLLSFWPHILNHLAYCHRPRWSVISSINFLSSHAFLSYPWRVIKNLSLISSIYGLYLFIYYYYYFCNLYYLQT